MRVSAPAPPEHVTWPTAASVCTPFQWGAALGFQGSASPQHSILVLLSNCISALPPAPGRPFQSVVWYLQKLLVFFRLLLHQRPDLVVVVVCDGLFHGHRAGHGALLPKQGSSSAWNGQIQKVKGGVDTTRDGDQVRVCQVAIWGWVIPCGGVSWTW